MPFFAETDPLGGWLQVILQAGAFGLLTYIVVIMYPKLTAEARAEREARDTQFASVVTLLQDRFDRRADAMVVAIREQTETIDSHFGRVAGQVNTVMAAVSSACKHTPPK